VRVKITPLDIRKQTFRTTFRGLDAEEVQAFLDVAAEEFERLNAENIELRERQASLREEVDRFRNLEATLQETLRTAQRASDEVLDNAKKEARLIIREAELRGNRAIEKARIHVQGIRDEIVGLKNQRDMFLARFNALVQAQSDFLAELSFTDPGVVDESPPPAESEGNGHAHVGEEAVPQRS
jgi:cell division initiation protein